MASELLCAWTIEPQLSSFARRSVVRILFIGLDLILSFVLFVCVNGQGDNTLKLCDPGLSSVLSQYCGTVVDNPLVYMSPEQLYEMFPMELQTFPAEWGCIGTPADMYVVVFLIFHVCVCGCMWMF